MTDEEVEKIIKSNMVLTMDFAGIRADFEKKLQRTWVGLTDEEISACSKGNMTRNGFARTIESKLKEKNT